MKPLTHRTLSRQAFLHGATVTAATTLFGGYEAEAKSSAPDWAADAKLAAKDTRVVLLGTAGGPIIRQARSQPATLVVSSGVPYLFDVGYGCLQQLRRCGFEARDLGGVFLSHLHTDHTIDLAAVLNFCWTGGRTTPLPIVGPPGTTRLFNAANAYFREAARVFVAQLPQRTLPDYFAPRDFGGGGMAYQDERVRVIAAENSHYSTFAHSTDKSLSYRVEVPGRVIAITGDTGPDPRLVALARDADVLVSEVIDVAKATDFAVRRTRLDRQAAEVLAEHMAQEHLPARDLGRLATAAGVRKVVLTHIVAGEDELGDGAALVREVRHFYAGPVVAGTDLMSF